MVYYSLHPMLADGISICIVIIAHLLFAFVSVVKDFQWKFEQELKEKDRYVKQCENQYQQQTQFLQNQYQNHRIVLDNEYLKQSRNFQQAKEKLVQEKLHLQKIIEERSQEFPYLANLFSEYYYLEDQKIKSHLKRKKQPALKAAETVSVISKEKKELVEQVKRAQYQVSFYESLFPWLEEFKEIPPMEAYEVSTHSIGDVYYERMKSWLSPEEFEKLSSAEKLQLAFDRYQNRKKTDWDIGIEFERYIGYCLEQRKARITYYGAIKKLEDMGRDLIAEIDDVVYIIQCKRWSKNKTLHEKHIFQLYGTSILYKINDAKHKKIVPVFVTTTSLSETARACANYLDILVYENIPIKSYPAIKCNLSKTGEKIYHLPFDQQYDTVVISPEKGECFVYTVKEAEELGFRHAYRWHGTV